MLFNAVWTSVLKPVRDDRNAPDDLRRTFHYLYWDIAWFGIVTGSTLAYLGVYAARLGATPFQLGLLSAGPAAVGLLVTLPAGHWLQRRPIGRAVFWSAVLSRINLLWWVFLPALLPDALQIWALVATVLVMTIPGTALAVGFNALYAAAVPLAWRSHVAGLRNAILSLVYVLTSLSAGFILNHTSLTLGYQIVFALGFAGAAMSTVQLWHLRSMTTETITEPEKIRSRLGDHARPGELRLMGFTLRTSVGLRAFTRGTNLLRTEALRGSYGRILAALFVFHVALYLPVPVFPLFWVEQLHFSDGEIGIGMAAFHGTVLIGSLQIARLATRWNNRQLASVGAVLLASYPLLTVFITDLAAFVMVSVLGGLAWAVVAGSLGNYLLEQLPEKDRPSYLAWYNMALNAAVLVGSLLGSLLAGWVGLGATLILSGVARALGGVAIWRWR
jgi:MFS family permease